MPTYLYQCTCGVRFDGTNPMSKSTEPKKCPDCGEMAPRMMPPTVAGHFNKDVDGPGPQNTGIHDLDTHVDRVIGKSADQGRAVIARRNAAKQQFIRDRGLEDPRRVAILPNGDFTVNSPDEQAFANRANDINATVMSAIKSKRAR